MEWRACVRGSGRVSKDLGGGGEEETVLVSTCRWQMDVSASSEVEVASCTRRERRDVDGDKKSGGRDMGKGLLL